MSSERDQNIQLKFGTKFMFVKSHDAVNEILICRALMWLNVGSINSFRHSGANYVYQRFWNIDAKMSHSLENAQNILQLELLKSWTNANYCNLTWSNFAPQDPMFRKIFHVSFFILGFLLPLTCIIFLYSILLKKVLCEDFTTKENKNAGDKNIFFSVWLALESYKKKWIFHNFYETFLIHADVRLNAFFEYLMFFLRIHWLLNHNVSWNLIVFPN